MTDKRSENSVKDQGKGVQGTPGDQGSHNPENLGREEKGAGPGDEKANRERTTEAGVVASNETKNHSQIAMEPGPGADPHKKPRKTTKGERGSRKPGTEQTKEERAAHT